jgi:glycine/D-amino acid oxidase-like deaminating enzyme
MPSDQTVVIGAGVIGLSCALDLQSAGHADITIIARDFPTPFALVDPKAQINFTSPWGGAHNRWVPPTGRAAHEARDHRLALATYRRMKALRGSSPEAGITLMKGVEYLEAPGAEYEALVGGGGGDVKGSAEDLGIEGFRVLGRDELPDDRVRLGFEYDTWCVNPMVYCSFLLNRFVFRGGRVVRREVREPKEVFEMGDLGGPVKTVVNASGTGFGDPKSFIIKGTFVLSIQGGETQPRR